MARGGVVVGLLVSVLVFSAAALARAENPAVGGHSPAAGSTEGSGHAGHGEPEERGIFDLALDLTIWTMVVFVVLYLVLRAWAWKPMLEGLQKREDNIRSALEEAQRAREEAQQVRAQLQRELAQNAEKVRDILDAARRDAERTTEEMVARARTEIQGERDRLRKEIDLARDQALHELWAQAAQLATVVSAKAIRRQLSPDDHRRLVEEALAELQHAGNDRQRQVASTRA
jgi:F-type H+-transporting ATPase subunit b